MQSQKVLGWAGDPWLRPSKAAVAMAIYLVVFFGLTLAAFQSTGARPNFVPFRTIEHDVRVGGHEFVVNILGNLAAGFPMGWLLPSLLGRRCSWAKVAGAGFLVSLVIEALQGISGKRVADVDDLTLNTVGSLLGYAAWLASARLLHQDSGTPCRSRGRVQE
jgi:glycopeptide antibiotics resistance protein